MPTTTSWASTRPNWRRRSRQLAPGTSSERSRSPWMPSAYHLVRPTWPPCPVANTDGWRCAGFCCPAPTCCCWTSPPTTWTPNRWHGWNAPCATTTAPWWPSPMTGTSWTTWPGGSWSWTGGKASPTRATTRAGWNRNRPVWPLRTGRTRPADAPWNASWNGCGWPPGHAKPRVRPAFRPTSVS